MMGAPLPQSEKSWEAGEAGKELWNCEGSPSHSGLPWTPGRGHRKGPVPGLEDANPALLSGCRSLAATCTHTPKRKRLGVVQSPHPEGSRREETLGGAPVLSPSPPSPKVSRPPKTT